MALRENHISIAAIIIIMTIIIKFVVFCHSFTNMYHVNILVYVYIIGERR